MTIQERFWPGYDHYVAAFQLGNNAVNEGEHKEAIRTYDEILGEPGPEPFSFQSDVVRNRTRSFSELLDGSLYAFSKLTSDPNVQLSETIERTGRILEDVSFVVDSLWSSAADLTADAEALENLSGRAHNTMGRIRLLLEAYRRQLNDRNTRWIIEGSVSAASLFKYIHMIETLAYAFTSLNVEDTAATAFLPSLPSRARKPAREVRSGGIVWYLYSSL